MNHGIQIAKVVNMSNTVIETFVGALVLIVAAFFLHFAYKTTDINIDNDTYTLIAKFEKADGITLGGDVKIGGVKIGKVKDISLDTKSFRATIKLAIKEEIKLPLDTSAEIISSGLVGDKYISLSPGSEEEYFENDGEIQFTQSSISIEALVGKFIFDSNKKK